QLAENMQRSSRDPEEQRVAMETWLRNTLGAESAPTVHGLQPTSANGMSSDTVLFDASWTEGSRDRHEELVARIAPDEADVPVFPDYELSKQFQVLRIVSERTAVPVPKVWWYEPESGPMGAPFFVMERMQGLVPPDVMPYTFGDNWLYDA